MNSAGAVELAEPLCISLRVAASSPTSSFPRRDRVEKSPSATLGRRLEPPSARVRPAATIRASAPSAIRPRSGSGA